MLSTYYDRPEISDEDVLNIRREVMAPDKVSKSHAEALMGLNAQIPKTTDAWKTLFTDAISDFMLDFHHVRICHNG